MESIGKCYARTAEDLPKAAERHGNDLATGQRRSGSHGDGKTVPALCNLRELIYRLANCRSFATS